MKFRTIDALLKALVSLLDNGKTKISGKKLHILVDT